ncbi:TPA: hypothetical protein EYP44_02670 [Candidatus Bathyarchaeota archaeon]|nr:hypothetical protein [Candidatus Bathyarchaeota archaeon]
MTVDQRRLLELQRRLEKAREEELRRMAILRRILAPKARQRLANLKMIRPDFVGQLEVELINLAASGKIEIPIGDDELKRILMRLQSRRREIKIKRL